MPAQVRRLIDHTALLVDGTGDTNAEAAHGTPIDLVAHARARLDHALDDSVCALSGKGLLPLRVEDLSLRVDGGCVHLGAAEIEPDREKITFHNTQR
jgi:hypothetical protein